MVAKVATLAVGATNSITGGTVRGVVAGAVWEAGCSAAVGTLTAGIGLGFGIVGCAIGSYALATQRTRG